MATIVDVVPSLGHAPAFLQGQGAPGYDAIDLRRLLVGGLQEGVFDAGSFEVKERGAGTNMTVDVAAGVGVGAAVQGDSVAAQALYHVPPHSGVINVDVAAAHATLPRVDSVVIQIKDDAHDSGGINKARVECLTGTATSGATLDNRTGAPSLPNSALLLADVHVPATDTSISNNQIRDRRKWARGAFRSILSLSSYTRNTAAYFDIDTANITARLECSGAPLRVMIEFDWDAASAPASVQVDLKQDGGLLGKARFDTANSGASTRIYRFCGVWLFTPSAGSHVFTPMWHSPDAVLLTMNRNFTGVHFSVEEIIRQNTPNNITTSG